MASNLFGSTNEPGSTIPASVPLRVQINHSYPLKIGTRIEGHLTEAVYVTDRLVLPVNTLIFGVIDGRQPVPGRQRAAAMMNGDFTPLATAKIVFDSVELPDHSLLPISTSVVERTSSIVHMTPPRSTSVKEKAAKEIKARKDEAVGEVTGPHKSDRVRRFLYGQLPYHPQEVWFSTEFDAELTAPVDVSQTVIQPPLPVLDADGAVPSGLLQARLTDTLDSRTTKSGTPVTAILSAPLFDKDRRHILLPEGTRLTGSVTHSSPAKSFARNGQLRFVFRKIELAGSEHSVHGQLAGAEAGAGQNLNIDSEGNARTTSPNKAVGTIVLGFLAASSLHHDSDSDGFGSAAKGGVVSNGFGILTRAAVMISGSRNVATGFAFFALSKNLYGKWIARGKDVTFPRDTRIEIDLAER
jgi:hypothetical protein